MADGVRVLAVTAGTWSFLFDFIFPSVLCEEVSLGAFQPRLISLVSHCTAPVHFPVVSWTSWRLWRVRSNNGRTRNGSGGSTPVGWRRRYFNGLSLLSRPRFSHFFLRKGTFLFVVWKVARLLFLYGRRMSFGEFGSNVRKASCLSGSRTLPLAGAQICARCALLVTSSSLRISVL